MDKKKLFGKLKNNTFFKGSIVMLIGSNFYNASQFIYHFLTGRFLGKVYYGDLAVIISILGIVAIIQLALGLTVVRFIAMEKNEDKISNFIKWIFFWSLGISILVSAIFIISAPFLSKFLNITNPISMYLLSPLILFFILVSFERSILQGLMKFEKYVISLSTEGVIKIILTALFLLLGFSIFGAIVGFLIGIIASFILTKSFLLPYLKGKREEKPDIRPLLRYSSATFIQGVALTSMYTMDLILVKHFFLPTEAGIYASLAILGRVVFFGASPVASVMFPLIAKKHSLGQPHVRTFLISCLAVALISSVIIVFYFFFPRIPIILLYGTEFLEGAQYLGWFGIFMGLLAFAMLFTQYFLSIGKTKIIWVFTAAALLQVILIWFIHPNILSVIRLSIVSATLLIVALFLYFVYINKNAKN